MNIIETAFTWAHALTIRKTTTHLVLHHTAGKGSVEDIHEGHKAKGWAGIGYHYYVRQDGTIYRGRPESAIGGHTSNWNYCSIGICFEGNFENETMSDAQFKAGQELIASIVERYPTITICKHSDLNPTACPGAKFPFDAITKYGRDEGDAENSDEAPAWAKAACDKAIQKGLFKGDENGKFNWNKPVTRAELAVLLDRL